MERSLLIKKERIIYFLIIVQLIMATVLSLLIKKNIIVVALVINLLIMVSILLLKFDYLLIIGTIISSFILTFLIENLGYTEKVRLILDYFIVLIGLKILFYYINRNIKFRKVYVLIVLFFIFTIISASINGIGLYKYINSIYFDYGRYFVIFIGVITLKIEHKTFIRIIKFLWGLLLIQVPIVILQDIYTRKNWISKLPGDIRQDYLSGILGGRGTTELGLLIVIALTTYLIMYLNKKVTLTKYLIISIILMIPVVLGEIKFVFVIIPIIFLIVLSSKINFKGIFIIVITMILISVGVTNLGKIYPEFDDFFNTDAILQYINTPYAGSGISRGNSIIVANDMIDESLVLRLFGRGISNANSYKDISNPTDFQIKNEYKLRIFNVSQFIVELGYLGVCCWYGLFIVGMYISCNLYKNKKNNFSTILGGMAIPSIIVIIIGTFYGMSMMKINFSVFSWLILGTVFRCYYSIKDKKYLGG